MIVTIQASRAIRHTALIDQMFKLRASVFSDRLKWNVDTDRERETDAFDEANPLYLLSVEDGVVRGSLRLLPTTGPNMLAHVFRELVEPGEEIQNPLIWESTRFCVAKDAATERSGSKINRTTGELLAGLVEVGLVAGLTSIVSVYDKRIKRVLEAAGYPPHQLGEAREIGGVTTYAGLFDVSEEALLKIREAAGIEGSVLDWSLPLAA